MTESLLRQLDYLDDDAQERVEDAIEDARHEKRLELLALRKRVALLETALGNLRDCFVFHTAVDKGRSGMIDWWTTKAATGSGNYEERGVPMSTVQVIRAANAALGEPVPEEEQRSDAVKASTGVIVAWTWRNGSRHYAGFATREAASAFIDSKRTDPEYYEWMVRPDLDEPVPEEEPTDV